MLTPLRWKPKARYCPILRRAVSGSLLDSTRQRLADAKFFYDQDRRYRLESRVPKLNSVVYHNKLGSQLDRVERVRAIGRFVADCTDANASWVDRAAYLAKADLLTEMVGEFPE